MKMKLPKNIGGKIIGVLIDYYNSVYDIKLDYIKKSNGLSRYKSIILLNQFYLFIIIGFTYFVALLTNLYKFYIIKKLLKSICVGFIVYKIFKIKYIILILVVFICYFLYLLVLHTYVLKESFVVCVAYLICDIDLKLTGIMEKINSVNE